MKRKFTFLIAAAMMLLTMMATTGEMWGQTTESYTITAKTGSGDGSNITTSTAVSDIFTATTYPNAITAATKAYYNGDNGIKLGTSSAAGSLTFSLTNAGQVNAQKITVNAKRYSSSKAATINITAGDVTGTAQSLTSSFANYEFTINNDITNIKIDASKYCWISSITVTYTSGSSTYTVSFDCDGGTANCPEDIEDLEEGDDFTIPSTAPTKDCYTFEGWFDDELNEYELGQTYQCPASDLALTAFWTINKYTVTYYSNNGETGEDIPVGNLECGSSYTIADNPGFTEPVATPNFVNWNTQADGQGTTYTVGQVITISGNMSLYAQWSALAIYDVVYDCNGGTENCPTDQSYPENTVIQLPAAPIYADHTFNGWLDDAEPAVNHAAGSDYTVTGDVYFTAQWLENLAAPTFTVTGVSNGTANTYYATASVTIQATNGATIYYTTDGTDPSMSSSVYSEPIIVNTEGTKTIKAFATKAGNGPSAIASQTVIIVNRADAEFTDGIYTTLNSENAYNTWYAYSVTGDQVWTWSSTYAKMTGYVNSTNYENEDWLISPKMHAVNGKLAVAFQCVGRYGNSGMATVYYSTNYPGYGNPNSYTWTEITTDPATLPYAASNWNFTDVTCTLNNEDVYFAVKYISSNTKAGTLEVKNFTAKQCYPITYYANGGTGTTADANSPYAVGTEVTILENGFTAPSGKEFTSWNTQANGEGTEKNPGQNITMTTAGYELYAQWGDACVLAATMNATTGEAAYNYNSGNKRFDISLSSSVHVLGGCDIFDYGFVYSTTVTTPTIGADNCTKVQVGDSQPTIDDPFEATIEDVTKEATYHVRSYATNAAGTAYSDVIDVEVPANFPVWTISYTTNGTADGTTTVDKGDAISGLATPTPANIPAGYTFTGWYGDDYALNNVAPTFVKNGDAINSDLALKAVFAIQTGGGSADTYSLVENVNDLHDGDIVVLYSTGSYTASQVVYDFSKANGGISNSLFSDVDVTVDNNQFTSSDVEPMTLVASGNSWKLQIGNQYVSAVNKGVSLDNTGSLNTITISDGTATITATISSTNYRLQYNPNNGNGRFAYYSSTQKSVKLYKQDSPIYSSYCTSVSPAPIPVDGNGEMTGNTTIPSGAAYTITTPVTVPESITLTVNGTLGNDVPANLIIEDGGQVIVNNTGVQATFKKSVSHGAAKTAANWYTISSPVNNIAPGSVTNLIQATPANYDLYYYDEATTTWFNHKADGHAVANMTNGKGYLYWNNGGDELSFPGELNSGDIEIAVTKTGETDLAGFNLIGNPYSHNIYKGTGTAIPNTNLSTGFYTLSNAGAWTAGTDNTTAIKPGQGILVKATAAGTVTMTNTTANGAKRNNEFIKFMIANSQYEDVAYALFNDEEGLNKINHRNANIPMLYIAQNEENYAIATMSDETQSFNLNFKAMTTGQYTLSYKAEGNYDYLHVIDRLTGEDIDILLDGEYSFIASPSDNDARFIVKLGYNANSNADNDIFAFQNGNDIIVNGEGELQVFDVTGRMVATQHVNGVQTVNVPSQGVFIFKLNEKTQKIVVR